MASRVQALPPWSAHAVTASRLGLTGVGYPLALAGERGLLTAVIAAAVATDLLDGPLARALGEAGGFGAQLDTVVDAGFYGSLLAWVYVLEPGAELFSEMGPLVAVFVVLVVGTLVLGRLRRGTMAYHTAFTRASATVGLAATLWTIHRGFELWTVQVLMAVLVVDLAHRVALIAGWIPPPEEAPDRREPG